MKTIAMLTAAALCTGLFSALPLRFQMMHMRTAAGESVQVETLEVVINRIEGDTLYVTPLEEAASSPNTSAPIALSAAYVRDHAQSGADASPWVGMHLIVSFDGTFQETYPLGFSGLCDIEIPAGQSAPSVEEAASPLSALTSSFSSYVCGDMNGDSSVDLEDMVGLAHYLLADRSISEEEWNRIDVNADGRVNGFDYSIERTQILENQPLQVRRQGFIPIAYQDGIHRKIEQYAIDDSTGRNAFITSTYDLEDFLYSTGFVTDLIEGAESDNFYDRWISEADEKNLREIFNEEFFAENAVALFPVYSSCGGFTYQMKNAAYEGDAFHVRYYDTRKATQAQIDVVSAGVGFITLPKDQVKENCYALWEEINLEQPLHTEVKTDHTRAVTDAAYDKANRKYGNNYFVIHNTMELEESATPTLRMGLLSRFRETYDEAFFNENVLILTYDHYYADYDHYDRFDQMIYLQNRDLLTIRFKPEYINGYIGEEGIALTQITVPKAEFPDNPQIIVETEGMQTVRNEGMIFPDFVPPAMGETGSAILWKNDSPEKKWVKTADEWEAWAEQALTVQGRAAVESALMYSDSFFRDNALYLEAIEITEGSEISLNRTVYTDGHLEVYLETPDTPDCCRTYELLCCVVPTAYADKEVRTYLDIHQERLLAGEQPYWYECPYDVPDAAENCPGYGLMVDPYSVPGSEKVYINFFWTRMAGASPAGALSFADEAVFETQPFTGNYTRTNDVGEAAPNNIYLMEDTGCTLTWGKTGVTIIYQTDGYMEHYTIPYRQAQ